MSDAPNRGTGTWLEAMARGLLDSGQVELGVIAPGPVTRFTRSDHGDVRQWLIPSGSALGRNGLPGAALVQSIVGACREFRPELVHTWGTEYFWGLLVARQLLDGAALLEMQGSKATIAPVFAGGLTRCEQLRCIGIKEAIKRRTIRSEQRAYADWGRREAEMIRAHRYIDVQSPWMAAQVKAINPQVRLFEVDRPLRQDFYDAPPWQPNRSPIIFCTSAYSAPFKGLHVAVRALHVLRRRQPGAILRIAGAHQASGIRRDGYIHWVSRIIRELGLQDAVQWLGPLSADCIVDELRAAAVALIPTFVESYCVALVEAMRVGTPVVASYTGGTGYLGKDEDSCLFFPPGDVAMCAYQLERVLLDCQLAVRLSSRGREVACRRNDRQRIIARQIDIYRQVLNESDVVKEQ